MRLIDHMPLSEPDTVTKSEFVFVPEVNGIDGLIGEVNFGDDRSADIEVSLAAAGHFLSQMGLSDVLTPDNPIIKTHDIVTGRVAAPEQFFHTDAALDGLAGVLLVGFEGTESQVPETEMVHNAVTLEFLNSAVRGGVLEDRLDEVFIVRPNWNPDDEVVDATWKDFHHQTLTRLLKDPFRAFFDDEFARHMNIDSGNTEYTGVEGTDEVTITPLISKSVIDGMPLMLCGVGSREDRLVLAGEQTDEESAALGELYTNIWAHLIGQQITSLSQKVTSGAGLFVPRNQLHRATPYDPEQHRRSVAAVKMYPKTEPIEFGSWTQEDVSVYL